MIGHIGFYKTEKFIKFCEDRKLNCGPNGNTVSEFTDKFFDYIKSLEDRIWELEQK